MADPFMAVVVILVAVAVVVACLVAVAVQVEMMRKLEAHSRNMAQSLGLLSQYAYTILADGIYVDRPEPESESGSEWDPPEPREYNVEYGREALTLEERVNLAAGQGYTYQEGWVDHNPDSGLWVLMSRPRGGRKEERDEQA